MTKASEFNGLELGLFDRPAPGSIRYWETHWAADSFAINSVLGEDRFPALNNLSLSDIHLRHCRTHALDHLHPTSLVLRPCWNWSYFMRTFLSLCRRFGLRSLEILEPPVWSHWDDTVCDLIDCLDVPQGLESLLSFRTGFT
jgi:hypothetical protein